MTRIMMIGQLAAATGTKVNTIRFYEDIGLMPKAERTRSGRRTYCESDLLRLTFIRRGRALGFSVDEIRSLIELSAKPGGDCRRAVEIARHHIREIEERVAALMKARIALEAAADDCECGRVSECRIIEAIALART